MQRYVVRLFWLGLLQMAACAPYQPGPLSAELSEDASGRIYFQSADAYDFVDYTGALPPRTVHGDLKMPEGEGSVRGAVILSHGSGGTGSRQRRLGEILVDRGFAVFELDHFAPREIGSTVRDQLRVTAQGMMGDVIAAQRLLQTHPRIDPEKIGVIGWSKGGIVALISAVDRFSAYAGRPAPLAFAVAFYPFCGYDLSGESLASPLLILIGDEDNWTPAGPCVREAERLQAAGEPVEIKVYRGAKHGFDSRIFDVEIGRAITVRDTSEKCTLRVNSEGQTVTLDGAQGVESLERRLAYLDVCGERGVTFGGLAEAREDAYLQINALLDRLLP